MKKLLLITALCISLSFAFAQSHENSNLMGVPNVTLSPMANEPVKGASGNVIFNNGPYINSNGTGAGGANESVEQNVTLGLSGIGWGCNAAGGSVMADDFTISSKQIIGNVLLYCYQTNWPSTATSPITKAYIQIYDGEPGNGGNIIWGDNATNRLISSSWSGAYRVQETTSGDANRPIMENVCEINTTLEAGTYWIAFQFDGSASYTGPWCPTVSINGVGNTGNCIQYFSGSWSTIYSGSYTQGVPFVITGSPAVPLHPAYIAGLFGLLVVGVVFKKRLF